MSEMGHFEPPRFEAAAAKLASIADAGEAIPQKTAAKAGGDGAWAGPQAASRAAKKIGSRPDISPDRG
jgi:hypothetical protein